MLNDDEGAVTLEHIMPLNPASGWEPDPSLYRKSGNLALVPSDGNQALGNLPFPQRAQSFIDAPYYHTRQVATYQEWTRAEIDDRRRKLAEATVETWPKTVGSDSTKGAKKRRQRPTR